MLVPTDQPQVKALIDRLLDSAVIEVVEQDDEAARALIALIDVVASEECDGIRKQIALDVTAMLYARTGAFYASAKAFASDARDEYLARRASRRTGGKRRLSKDN